MRFIIAAAALIASLMSANAATTCNTVDGARELHGPAAHLKYTAYAPLHRGVKCWFNGAHGYDASEPQINDVMQPVAAAVPMPRARPRTVAQELMTASDPLLHATDDEVYHYYAYGYYTRHFQAVFAAHRPDVKF